MLPSVAMARFHGAPFTRIDNYRPLVGDGLVDEILSLARDLRGLRICHVNSTGFGGGVAELLARHVPLSRGLGLAAEWRLMLGNPEFFAVTKALHNALQGAGWEMHPGLIETYLDANRESARLLQSRYDVVMVHDPQPAALRESAGRRGSHWIWRCHIDTSAPNPRAAEFLRPLLSPYDALVFTMRDFALPGLDPARITAIAPAIDPFSTKNMELPESLCRGAVVDSGIDPRRPFVLQVSRFDPWKDPMGVIEAYKLARREVPGLQLALVGAMAGDDPEGWRLLSRVEEAASDDPDIQVMTNMQGVGNMEVNAFQRAADLVVQKSLREGFGLVVSESFWKGKPMVCGRAGGIPMQYPPGYEEFLVDSVEECAADMVTLLRDPGRARAFGSAARERVAREFLLPRLLRDELKLLKEVLAGESRGPDFAFSDGRGGAGHEGTAHPDHP
jgi:trehalose synthase